MRLILLLIVAATMSACSNAAPESDGSISSDSVPTEPPPSVGGTTTTSISVAPPGGLVWPDCDDVEVGACAAAFLLDDGVFYYLSCNAIKDSAVSGEVIGEGEFEGQTVKVNTVEEIPRTVMVAVSLPGGLCADGDQVQSDWSMAFPQGADEETLMEAICAVGELTAAQREANDC